MHVWMRIVNFFHRGGLGFHQPLSWPCVQPRLFRSLSGSVLIQAYPSFYRNIILPCVPYFGPLALAVVFLGGRPRLFGADAAVDATAAGVFSVVTLGGLPLLLGAGGTVDEAVGAVAGAATVAGATSDTTR